MLKCTTGYVNILLIVAALTATIERSFSKNTSIFSVNAGYFIGGLLGGSLVVYSLYFISAWIFYYFGKAFLNGKATAKEFRTVIAWSNIPSIGSIIFSFLILVVYGSNALSDFYFPISKIEKTVFISFALIQFALSIWTIVIMIIGTKEIQKFSTLKAISNVSIPFLILIIIFLLFFSITYLL